MAKNKRKRKKKNRVFCRLYKYTCGSCGKQRHKRHFARNGDTCDTCESKIPKIDPAQGILFNNEELNNEKPNI